MAEIYIISGFLGAGKTTLIQKLLKDGFQDKKIALIENDFGDISVDAALLKSGNVEVTEINSGCICCNLSGNFIKALQELLRRFKPDAIFIEPSGVGKLSDIIKSCSDKSIRPFAKVTAKITVADVKRFKIYLNNFGEFFEDQIQNADTILLSHSEDFHHKTNEAIDLIKKLNKNAAILSKPWDKISIEEILPSKYNSNTHALLHKHVKKCSCNHVHHNAISSYACNHSHSAEEVFDTVTIRTSKAFTIEDLESRISYMERNAEGTILRAKGILKGINGYIHLQYLPENINITNCSVDGDMLCIIGQDLNRQELINLFNGE